MDLRNHGGPKLLRSVHLRPAAPKMGQGKPRWCVRGVLGGNQVDILVANVS